VVVLHEIWGATSRIGCVTSQLCAAGYAATAPQLYHRQLDPVITDGNIRRAQQLLRTLSKAEIEHDVISAIDYLARAGAEKIGILGFSMGATIALWAAGSVSLKWPRCDGDIWPRPGPTPVGVTAVGGPTFDTPGVSCSG